MAKQLNLFAKEEGEKKPSIYEIYMLDSFLYPHSRSYHSHIKFVMAPNEDEATNQETCLFEAARKDKQYLDVREVTRADVEKRSLVLEGQLDACYRIFQAFDQR